ncbi:glycosyltransferase family 4 protein, partial [Candidatus Daviesbacteria bacterium]|nr:glycosyltransferase family 4 protein [Candidatus Daviesbacteria bacterium]
SEQVKLPLVFKKIKPDLVHFPHFNVPIFYGGSYVVTVHDLIHQRFQMRRSTTRDPLTYKIKQFGYNLAFKAALRKSKKILVPSNFVKNQLMNEWSQSSGKILVTYEGVDEKLLQLIQKISAGDAKKIVSSLNIKTPFIFYVGNAHPHKNVEGLIKAFGGLKRQFPNLSLVLSGHDHYFWQRIVKEFPAQKVIYTGYISDEQMIALYKTAEVFVMPSFEEGFGIPVLEAMAAGCSVVSSDRGSLPEVGGNASLYFDPSSLEDMNTKISQVLSKPQLRKELIDKGKIRYKEFSWERLAKQTLNVYNLV